MSSHHIVRDEQEPALIITDFSDLQEENIGQLLEWSPTVIAMEAALADLLTLGIKVDVVVLSPDNTAYWEERLIYQQPIRIFTSDSPLFEQHIQVIRQLQKENYRSFHLLGNQLSLFDFINLYEHFKGRAEVIFFKSDRKISISPVGNFKKWLRRQQGVAVFPISERTYIRTNGFVNDLDNELLQSELQFICEDEGLVTIETNLQPLVIAEEL